MPARDPIANVEQDLDTLLLQLQKRVLSTVLLWFSVAGVATAVLQVYQAYSAGLLTPSILAGVAFPALIPVFALLQNRLGFRVTAIAFLTHLGALIMYIQCFRGLVPATALVSAAYMLLAGLLFGRRGAVIALTTMLLGLLSAALISLRGWVEPWSELFWDPRLPIVWLRYGVLLTLVGMALTVAHMQIHAGLERLARALHDTLLRERAERDRRELAQQALERSRRLEALAEFAGGLAHDFNNCLMLVMGGATMIGNEPHISPRVAALAEEVIRSAETSAELVRQLLTLGRRDRAQPQKVSAGALLRNCESTLRQALPRGITFWVEPSSEACLMVDVARLQHCLLNLAINARDALGETGNFSIRSEERTVDDVPEGWNAHPGRFVVLHCVDDGPGIPEAIQQRVFEPFFSTKGSNKGSGLGLAMVHGVVHEAGGFVVLESEPGRGTSIRLHFPCASGVAEPAAAGADERA